jgi:hypothetical protein
MSAIPDYTQRDAWLLRPETPVAAADVFYLIPTEYHQGKEPPVCEIGNPTVRALGMRHLQHKASAFFPAGNVYAPMYRQANVPCLMSTDRRHREAMIDGPIASCAAAFTYYMKHLNGGRPFILAGHSQGALMAKILLGTVFKKHPEYHERLIAAYIIGFGVTPEDLARDPHLHMAQRADDTDVIISYNTEAPGITARNITLPEGSLCINPVSWRTDTTKAPASQSHGSHLVRYDEKGRLCVAEDRPHFADAAIDPKRGVVVCTTADPKDFRVAGEEAPYFPRGVLHTGDLPLYYYDIQKNALDRTRAWMKQHGDLK